MREQARVRGQRARAFQERAADGDLRNVVLVRARRARSAAAELVEEEARLARRAAAAAPCAAALNASGEGVTSVNADCRPCAWPARLRRWLRAAYPHAASVKVDNRAVGATNSRTVFGFLSAAELAAREYDVVFLSYTENDETDGEKMGARSRDARDFSRIASSYEALLRMLLALPNRPAVIDVQVCE